MRKRKRFKVNKVQEKVSQVNNPSLKWLEEGQVIYAEVRWGPHDYEAKRRPARFEYSQARDEAVVRPFYSRPRLGGEVVWYRRRKSFLGSEVVIHRSHIVAISDAKVYPEYEPLTDV